MKIFHREIGEGKNNLIIIHGLYGCSDNWISIARKLSSACAKTPVSDAKSSFSRLAKAEDPPFTGVNEESSDKHNEENGVLAQRLSSDFKIYIPDIRNHGKSFWSEKNDYDSLVGDLRRFILDLNIKSPIIMGHSMGGKIAMKFTASYPEIVKKLIIIDISPANTDPFQKHGEHSHSEIIKILNNINLSQIKNTSEAIELLKKKFNSENFARFMLKNISKENGIMKWKINITAINKAIHEIMEETPNESARIYNPALFIKGGASQYVTTKGEKMIKTIFLNSQIKVIPETSHWLHVEEPEKLVRIIKDFAN
jgi:pimeloyl-ACP methyl ester carboxylesterase